MRLTRPSEVERMVISNGASDISGQRHGKLSIQYPVAWDDESGTLRQYWLASCECGEHVLISAQAWVQGRYRSHCGCGYVYAHVDPGSYSKREVGPRGQDIAGRRYGHLSSLYPVSVEGRRDVYWLCECDCGRYCVSQVWQLENGKVEHCSGGCPFYVGGRAVSPGERRVQRSDLVKGTGPADVETLRAVETVKEERVDKETAVMILKSLRERGFRLTKGVVDLRKLKSGEAAAYRDGDDWIVGYMP